MTTISGGTGAEGYNPMAWETWVPGEGWKAMSHFTVTEWVMLITVLLVILCVISVVFKIEKATKEEMRRCLEKERSYSTYRR